jgi:hypothetical protein
MIESMRGKWQTRMQCRHAAASSHCTCELKVALSPFSGLRTQEAYRDVYNDNKIVIH